METPLVIRKDVALNTSQINMSARTLRGQRGGAAHTMADKQSMYGASPQGRGYRATSDMGCNVMSAGACMSASLATYPNKHASC